MGGSLQIVIGSCNGFKYFKQIQKRISGLNGIIQERSLTSSFVNKPYTLEKNHGSKHLSTQKVF